jgi:hypothetical protein
MPSAVSIVLASILVADLLWWRRADVRARRLRHALGWRLLIGLFMGGQIALVLWLLGGRASAAPSLGRPPQSLSAAAYLWHLLLLPAGWVLVATTGLLLRAWRWGRRQAGRADPLPPATLLPAAGVGEAATRRQFLGTLTAAAPVLLTGAGVACSRTQLHEFRVRPIGVALPGLPPELDGLRIALVSDLHVGTFTSSRTVQRVVEETSRLNADLVLLPGDLINNALTDLSDALDAVRNMQSRYGAYLCVGNHDLIEDGAEFVRRVKARAPPARQRVPGRPGPGPARPVARPALGARRGRDRQLGPAAGRPGRPGRLPDPPGPPPARLRRRRRRGHPADGLRAHPRRPADAR